MCTANLFVNSAVCDYFVRTQYNRETTKNNVRNTVDLMLFLKLNKQIKQDLYKGTIVILFYRTSFNFFHNV